MTPSHFMTVALLTLEWAWVPPSQPSTSLLQSFLKRELSGPLLHKAFSNFLSHIPAPSRTYSSLYHDHSSLHTGVHLMTHDYSFAYCLPWWNDHFCDHFCIPCPNSGLCTGSIQSSVWQNKRRLNSSSDSPSSTSGEHSWIIINTHFVILLIPYLPVSSCSKETIETETGMPRQVLMCL